MPAPSLLLRLSGEDLSADIPLREASWGKRTAVQALREKALPAQAQDAELPWALCGRHLSTPFTTLPGDWLSMLPSTINHVVVLPHPHGNQDQAH